MVTTVSRMPDIKTRLMVSTVSGMREMAEVIDGP
jgi:hypothetical protein